MELDPEMKSPDDDFFASLETELELLAKAAQTLENQQAVGKRLKGLRQTVQQLGEYVAKGNIPHDDAEFAFKSELQGFIRFLNGRLDEP